MKATHRLMSIVVGLFFASCVSIAQAGYINLNNVSGNLWEIQFSPITLTVKSSPGTDRLDWLVFEDFFGAGSMDKGKKSGVQSISISVNGGVASSFAVNNSIGTLSVTNGGIDPNDLFINIAQDVATASPGDTIVVTQNGTGVRFTSTDVPILNPSWNGQVAFWANADGSRLMTTENAFITVPAPASIALLGLGLAGLGWFRRKKA